jgi:hypothetical protein
MSILPVVIKTHGFWHFWLRKHWFVAPSRRKSSEIGPFQIRWETFRHSADNHLHIGEDEKVIG